jgi:ATP-dependent Clp protease, protease subunit
MEPKKVLKSVEKEVGTIYLYNYIGYDDYWDEERKELAITDIEIVKTLKEMEAEGVKRVNVRINSPGGSIKHGDGIIAALQNSKMEIHGYVDGMAASMAADIFFAIKKANRHMGKNSKLMVHGPIGGAWGNSKVLRLEAEKLDTFGAAAAAQMAADTGLTEKYIVENYFDGNDHWLTAKEAAKVGFIPDVDDYETETPTVDAEKMTHEQLMRYFGQTQKVENNIFKKINAFIRKSFSGEPISEPVKIEEKEMKSIEDIIKACELGELNLIDLQERLQKVKPVENPAPVANATVATTMDIEKKMNELIEQKMKPVLEENTALKAQVEKMGKQAASRPTEIEVEGDGNLDDDDADALKELNETMTKAAKSNEGVKIVGGGTFGVPRRK